MSSTNVETVLFDLLSVKDNGKSVTPEEIARIVNPEAWRRVLPQVRSTSIGLARQGKLVITRHGKPVDPDQFRGVYRLRLPLPGENLPGSTPLTGQTEIETEETS